MALKSYFLHITAAVVMMALLALVHPHTNKSWSRILAVALLPARPRVLAAQKWRWVLAAHSTHQLVLDIQQARLVLKQQQQVLAHLVLVTRVGLALLGLSVQVVNVHGEYDMC